MISRFILLYLLWLQGSWQDERGPEQPQGWRERCRRRWRCRTSREGRRARDERSGDLLLLILHPFFVLFNLCILYQKVFLSSFLILFKESGRNERSYIVRRTVLLVHEDDGRALTGTQSRNHSFLQSSSKISKSAFYKPIILQLVFILGW